MKKIFEIIEGGFELKLIGNNQDKRLHDQYFFFPVIIEFHNGSFSAKKKIEMEIAYIESFAENLEDVCKNIKGSAARIENLDQDFSILFESNELGQININGVLIDGAVRENKLEFSVQINQSHLPQVIEDSYRFIKQE